MNKGFIVQKTGIETTIFDSDDSILYTFNNVGADILEQIKRGNELEKIVIKIVKKYQIEKEKAKKDVTDFMQELLRLKIIVEI